MLTWFRDKAKIFLIATIVIFVALIFFNWGMDAGSTMPSDPYERPIARVAGSDVLPDEYNQSIQDLTERYRQTLDASGHPDPEAMLMLMSEVLAEEAFTGMVDSRLEEVYLDAHGWRQVTVDQAEAMLLAQVSMQDLGGMTPEEYVQQIIEQQPGLYEQYLYQAYASAQTLRFPLAAGLLSMIPDAEVDFLIQDTQGLISARYVVFDSIPPAPGEQALRDFYDANPGLFSRPAGALVRFVTIRVTPGPDDVQYAIDTADSLSFATGGATMSATREQFVTAFGRDDMLVPGQRSLPFLATCSGNPAISSCYVLLLDSVSACADPVAPLDSVLPGSLDTLHFRSWEVPVLPGVATVRSLMWRIEDGLEPLLADAVPVLGDSLVLAGFGNQMIYEDSPLLGIVTEELVTFATDTLWSDSIGPVFFSPSYEGGYPAFTAVRRMERHPERTIGFEEALDSGILREAAMSASRRDASRAAAEAALERMLASGVNLGTWAAAESMTVLSTPQFTSSQVRQSSYADPDAAAGLLSSEEFSFASLTAPEFQVVGPFRTGDAWVLAEIVSRQAPQDNESVSSMMHAAAQRGGDLTAMRHVISVLRRENEVEDLREEWRDFVSSMEDSLAATGADSLP